MFDGHTELDWHEHCPLFSTLRIQPKFEAIGAAVRTAPTVNTARK